MLFAPVTPDAQIGFKELIPDEWFKDPSIKRLSLEKRMLTFATQCLQFITGKAVTDFTIGHSIRLSIVFLALYWVIERGGNILANL